MSGSASINAAAASMGEVPPLSHNNSLDNEKQDRDKMDEKSPLTGNDEMSRERCVPMKWFLLGMGGVFLSHAVQGLSAAGVQILNGAMPSFELNFWRVTPVAVFLLPLLMWKGMNLRIPRHKIHILLLLITAYNTQNITYYYAARWVALGTLSAMQVSLAITFSTVLSICIKAERSAFLYLGAVISIIGLIFMAQPTFLGFDHSDMSTVPLNRSSPCVHHIPSNSTEAARAPAPAMGFISAVGALLIVVSAAGIVCQANCNKLLVYEGIPCLVISWWTAVGSVLPSLILMFIFETPVILKSPFCSLLVALHCVAVEQSLIIVPWSVMYVLPAIVAMSYATQIIVQLICQYTFLKHIQPGFNNWQEVFGATLCILGIMVGPLGHMAMKEIQKKRAAKTHEANMKCDTTMTRDTKLE